MNEVHEFMSRFGKDVETKWGLYIDDNLEDKVKFTPAGGNLKEPVTENTKKVARCFYALEQERADRKRYPAVNPIDSYSKYLEYPEFEDYITERINNQWTGKVNELKTRLLRGGSSVVTVTM